MALRLTIAVLAILAQLSLFVYTARGQINNSCMQLNTTTEELLANNDCNEADQIIRFYYNSSSQSCNPVFTCPNDTTGNNNTSNNTSTGHRSLAECKSKCGLSKTCPKLTASNIIHATCTTFSSNCKAFYHCEQGYIFFGSSKRTCKNGVWSPEPICRKIGLYHNGQLLRPKQVINLNSSLETIECRVLPSPLPTGISLRWTLSKNTVPGQWNDDRTAYKLVVSNKDTERGTWPREYYCNATQTINGVETFLATSVIFNVTVTSKKPEIIYHKTIYNPSLSQVKGDCLCKGLPKPSVKWFINNTEFTGGYLIGDATPTAKDFTISMLIINSATPAQHSGNYHCQCISGPHTVNSNTINVAITTEQTVSRRKRSITRVKETMDIPPCSSHLTKDSTSQVTLIVGNVIRYLKSDKTLHVKVSTETSKSFHNNSILKLKLQNTATENDDVQRNTPYIMLIEKQDKNSYVLLTKLPYSKQLLSSLNKDCQMSQ